MPGFELFDQAEKAEVQSVMDTGVLMRYGFDNLRDNEFKAQKMEQLLCAKTGVKQALLTSSGTAALGTSLQAMGVGWGDEVILPVFTFVACFEAVLSVGAVPVLCDIDKTLGLDPLAVKTAITERTKAVMAVHMCGGVCRISELQELCRENNLWLLEDACQSIGGSYNGKALGSFGDAGCFSFDFVKTVSCGEGGAVISNNEDLITKARAFTDHGHTHEGNDRGAEPHYFMGFNYRISELHAAVGLAQLKKLDRFLEIQKGNYAIFNEVICQIPAVEKRETPAGGVPNYSFLNFYLPEPEMALNASRILREKGMDCFYWYNNNWHYHKKWEHLKQVKSLSPVSESIANRIKESSTADFSRSDYWMSRNISLLIKLGWQVEETKRRAGLLEKTLLEVLEAARTT